MTASRADSTFRTPGRARGALAVRLQTMRTHGRTEERAAETEKQVEKVLIVNIYILYLFNNICAPFCLVSCFSDVASQFEVHPQQWCMSTTCIFDFRFLYIYMDTPDVIWLFSYTITATLQLTVLALAQDYRRHLAYSSPPPHDHDMYILPPDCDYMPVFVSSTFGGRARQLYSSLASYRYS